MLKYCWDCKMVQSYENKLEVPQKVKQCYHMTLQFCAWYTQKRIRKQVSVLKYMHMHLHSITIHNSQKIQTAQIPLNV